MKLLSLLLIFWTSLTFAESKPSFDCTKAKNTVEKEICESPDLGNWDSILAETFNQKKGNSKFKREYLSWLKDRDQCNKSGSYALFCLREKYAEIFGLIFSKYDGPSTPIVPHFECFRPFIPYENGDQGFYATRLISKIRGCENLNFNVAGSSTETKYQVKFMNKDQNTYYYSVDETEGNELTTYKIGVRFETKKVITDKKTESTLVMTLVETTRQGVYKLDK